MLVLGLVELPWWALILILLVVWYLYETYYFGVFKKLGIPHEKPFPVFGTLGTYAKGPIAGDTELLEKYRETGYFGEFMGRQPCLVVHDADMLAAILVKQHQSFLNHMPFSDPASWISKMLPCLEDGEWKHARSEISPWFSSGKLKKMNDDINECSKVFAENLLVKAQRAEEVDVNALHSRERFTQYCLQQCELLQPVHIEESEFQWREEWNFEIEIWCTGGFALDVIATTAFGLKLNSLKDDDSDFVKVVKKMFDIKSTSPGLILMVLCPKIAWVCGKLGMSLDPYDKSAQEYLINIAKQLLKEREDPKYNSKNDFLQIMLRAQRGEDIRDKDDTSSAKTKGLSTDIVLGNAMGFLAGGYDTTLATISFLFYSLATNQDIQLRLIEEIDSIVDSKTRLGCNALCVNDHWLHAPLEDCPTVKIVQQCSPSGVVWPASVDAQAYDTRDNVDYDKLTELPYTEQCILETLRRFPPFIKSNRWSSEDATVCGVFIPKHTAINIPVYAIHNDPQKWPNPEVFDPDRFTPENKQKRNAFYFLPFSRGPRQCLAMRLVLQEIKLAVVHVLKRVTIQVCENTELKINDNAMVLKPEGLRLKFVER